MKKLEPILVALAVAFALLFVFVWFAYNAPTKGNRDAFGVFAVLEAFFVMFLGLVAVFNGKVV